MIYKIIPEHFGLTKMKRLLYAVVMLVWLALVIVFSKWITSRWPSTAQATFGDWTISDIPEIMIWLISYVIWILWWLSSNYYSLEIDDNAARVGRRMVRKGHVRSLHEFKGGLFQGPRMELSEKGQLWFGSVITVPKGLPQYEQIKTQVSTWIV